MFLDELGRMPETPALEGGMPYLVAGVRRSGDIGLRWLTGARERSQWL